jgi:hypothetical protein
MAELRDGTAVVHPSPVMFNDIEIRGIDIPAYTVADNKVIAVYFDDYGPSRTGKTSNAYLAESTDGILFSKYALQTQFERLERYSRVGLPWLLNDGDGVRVYMRGKRDGKVFLLMSYLDVATRTLSDFKEIAECLRDTINVSVTKRMGKYFFMYGKTTGGGFYVTPSDDGLSFDFSKEIMIVSGESEWGWDFHKICPSPDNLTTDMVSLCWTGGANLSIGYGSFSAKALV